MTHDWKAVQLNMKKGGGKILLFDLSKDIEEQNDVAASNPEIVANFKKIFEEAHTPFSTSQVEKVGSPSEDKGVKPFQYSQPFVAACERNVRVCSGQLYWTLR